jgi:hypothetical protein
MRPGPNRVSLKSFLERAGFMNLRTNSWRLIPAALLALSQIGFGSSIARADLHTGLSAYYHLDGNGLDSTGSGLDLILVGGAGFGTGLYGQALNLHDVPTQYATRPGDDSTFNLGSNDFAIQVWVNFNAFGGREQTLIEKWTGAAGPGWTLTTPSGNRLVFAASGLQSLDVPVSFTPGTWNQIIVDRSGSTLSLYLDGSLLMSNTNAIGSIAPSTNPLLIGRRDAQDPRDFSVDGRLDEIAFWDRALTTSEVTNLWDGGKGMLITSAVPEPSSLWLSLTGLGAMGIRWSIRRRSRLGRGS